MSDIIFQVSVLYCSLFDSAYVATAISIEIINVQKLDQP